MVNFKEGRHFGWSFCTKIQYLILTVEVGFGMSVQGRHRRNMRLPEAMHFFRFKDISHSEWVLFKCLDETPSKFSFRNTCGKVK